MPMVVPCVCNVGGNCLGLIGGCCWKGLAMLYLNLMKKI